MRGHRQVGVDVAAGHAVLHPQAGTVADHPQRAGAVVASPGDRGGRERAGLEPLVGVDVRRVEQGELAQRGLDAGDEVVEHLALPSVAAVVGEHDRAVLAPQRQVDVAAVALALVVLGHERQRLAVRGRDLLGRRLVDRVVVAGADDLVVAEGDLVLAEVALPLGALDGHARGVHLVADVAQQRLDPACRPGSSSRRCSGWRAVRPR